MFETTNQTFMPTNHSEKTLEKDTATLGAGHFHTRRLREPQVFTPLADSISDATMIATVCLRC
jgi:hypothetical protein